MPDTIAKQFSRMDGARDRMMKRLRQCSLFSLPWILPVTEDKPSEDDLPETFQTMGAEGVKSLQGRLVTALFPVGTPWFGFRPTPELDSRMDDETRDEVRKYLDLVELQVQGQLDQTNYRKAFRSIIENGIVTGNWAYGVIDESPEWAPSSLPPYSIKVFRLDQYVVKRAGDGGILTAIIKETVDPLEISEHMAGMAQLNLQDFIDRHPGQDIPIYTHVRRQSDMSWVVTQEMNDHVIGEPSEHRKDVLPFDFGRYDEPSGHDYGRGMCEILLGSLRSHNGLSRAILEMAAASSRVIGVKDQSSPTTIHELSTLGNGKFVIGNVRGGQVQDIAFLASNLGGDFAIAASENHRVEERLGKAFLMESAVQPTGERVTATQIMRLAGELDGRLGDVYSGMSEMQGPYLRRVVYMMERDNIIETQSDDNVQVTLMTGLEALRRSQDLTKLVSVLQMVAQIPGSTERINWKVVNDRVFSLTGIDVRGIVKSDEQLAMEQQQAMEQAAMEQAASKAVDVGGNIVAQQEAA